jgi:3-oxoacyl-[acyl-carrier-protein] synthase-3
MAFVTTANARIAGVCSCVPAARFDNLRDPVDFSSDEVRKVTAMAGVASRRIADDSVCSSDLCTAAAARLLRTLAWDPASVDALIMITQTPDYFLPSTSCVVHGNLGLADHCAAFDLGLGCSGYPYGLWLASTMLQNQGFRRVLVLHGETPSRFADKADRSVSLLFGDAGSATAVERCQEHRNWHFALHSDGSAYRSMIIEAGGFRNRFNEEPRKHCVAMDGALVFTFTIRRIPALITETLARAGVERDEIDYFIFHQSNQYIIKHICVRHALPPEKVPLVLHQFGNTGGPSIPLTLTAGGLRRDPERALRLLLLGYGVGLSWASGLVDLTPDATLETIELATPESGSR